MSEDCFLLWEPPLPQPWSHGHCSQKTQNPAITIDGSFLDCVILLNAQKSKMLQKRRNSAETEGEVTRVDMVCPFREWDPPLESKPDLSACSLCSLPTHYPHWHFRNSQFTWEGAGKEEEAEQVTNCGYS